MHLTKIFDFCKEKSQEKEQKYIKEQNKKASSIQ